VSFSVRHEERTIAKARRATLALDGHDSIRAVLYLRISSPMRSFKKLQAIEFGHVVPSSGRTRLRTFPVVFGAIAREDQQRLSAR
jgi:hypothetical protein